MKAKNPVLFYFILKREELKVSKTYKGEMYEKRLGATGLR